MITPPASLRTSLRLRWVALGAALALAWLISPSAMAAELGLTLEGRPTPTILANGLSTAFVPVLIRDEVGSPLLSEAEVTGAADLGEVLGAWSPGPGLYLVRYRPPAVQRPQTATLTLTAEQGARRGTGRVQVKLTPAGWGSIEIRPRPMPLVLGQDPGAQVTYIPRDLSGQPYQARDLKIAVSRGTLGDLGDMQDGHWTAPYALPDATWPQLAILTAVDADAPGRYGFFVLPMTGTTRFPVQAEPGVKLTFSIGDRVFDPVVTDPEGFAQVELLVQPGDRFATIQSVDTEGVTQEDRLDLSPPPSRRLALIAPARGLPGDGKTAVTLRVLVVQPDGSPQEGARLQIDAALGTVGPIVEEGAGLYQATFTPPAIADASTSVAITARLLPPLPPVAPPLESELGKISAAEGAPAPATALAAAPIPPPSPGEMLPADPDLEAQQHTVTVRILPPDQAIPPEAPPNLAPRDPVDWMSLSLGQDQIPADAPSRVTIEVKGHRTQGGTAPLSPELQLLSTTGTFEERRVGPGGSLLATLSLPPLSEGATVAVVVADPELGQSTWKLLYAGDAPARSLPADVGPVVRVGDPPNPSVAKAAPNPGDAPPTGDEGPAAAVEDAPPTEEVLAPPPKTLKVRGTRLYPLYAVGAYRYSQQSTDPDSPVADGYGIKAPTLFGIGLGLDHWLRTNVGVSGRYLVGNYGFDPGDRLAVPGDISSFYHVGTADLRFRLFKPISGGAISAGIRLGGGRTTHPFFEVQEQGVVYIDNNVLWLARGGIDLEALVMEQVELAARYDLGVDPTTLTPTTHHGELGAGWRANEVVSVGVTGELWRREIAAVSEGETLGTLSDQWILGWLYVAITY